MKARLVSRLRPGATRVFELPEGEALVGRERGAAVPILANGVSRRHARILWDGQNHHIEDLKSTNGTFVNRQLIHREKLQHLDVITLGRHCDLVFLSEAPPLGYRLPSPRDALPGGILCAALVPVAAHAAPREIDRGKLLLGRSADCDIVADALGVSKVHAFLERGGGRLVLHDLGSLNGTFVNGKSVEEAVLSDGDLVSLAGVANFRVILRTGGPLTQPDHLPRVKVTLVGSGIDAP